MNHYPHHIGDFLKDTIGLTDQEELAYRRLIEAYYGREHGFTTDEAFRAARAVGDEGKCAAVSYILSTYFSSDESGVWHQKRIEAEIALYRARSALATKAAKVRWDCGRNAPALPPVCQPEPEPEPKKKEPTPTPSAPPALNWFGEFWDAYPQHRRVGRKPCREKWRKRGLEAEASAILDGLRRWKESAEWRKDGGQYVPSPMVFLNQDRWLDTVAAMAAAPGKYNADGTLRVVL